MVTVCAILPSTQIPLGYQPPPTGPVVNEYSSDAFYQQSAQPRQQQQLTMVHVRNNGQQQQIQQRWTPNNNNNSFNSNSSNGCRLKRSEQGGVIRQLDTQARTFLPLTQVVPASRRHESPNQLLAVKAFAATNSSKISTAELEMELNKELESSIPMILEELDKVEKAQKQLQKSNAIHHASHSTTVSSNKPGNQVGEVDPSDLEKLIEEANSNTRISQAEETSETAGEITTAATAGLEIGQKTETTTEGTSSTSQRMPVSETSQAPESPPTVSKEGELSTSPSFVTEGTIEAAGTTTIKGTQEILEISSIPQITVEAKEVVSEGTTIALSEDITTIHLLSWKKQPDIRQCRIRLPRVWFEYTRIPEITSTSEEPSQETCPEPSADGGNVKGDVLFLLDSSSSVGAEQFQRSVQLIHDTVEHLSNVSLIQYNREPFLEFTFRRHNCLSNMLSDIANTQFMNGVSNLGRAIEKVMKFAFTKSRGDRPEAENVVVLVTDGRSDDEWQIPLELAKSNGTTMLVIATVKANKTDLMMLADDRKQNLFNLTEVALNIPLAERLAKRIKEVATQSVPPSFTSSQKIGNEVQLNSGEQGEESSAPAENNDLLVSEGTLSTAEYSSSSPTTTSLADPTVSVECLSDGIKAVFHLASSFKGLIVAKDAVEDPDCSREIQPVDFNSQQDMKTVEMEIRSPNCGLHLMKSESPNGQNISIVLSVIHDKRLITGVDRSFIIQCFVPLLSSDLQNEGVLAGEEVETSLKILPKHPQMQLSLRRDSPNGAILQAAAVGQILFHRWECDGGKDSNRVFGVHIYDCRATNHSSQEDARSYSIIDKKWMYADPSLLGEVVYAEDRLLAYAKAFVFTLRDVDSLKFSCKIGLCVRNGTVAKATLYVICVPTSYKKNIFFDLQPPTCSSSNVSEMLLSAKNQRLQDSAIDAALTSQVDSPKIAVMSASAFGGGKGSRLLGGVSGSHWRRLSPWSIAIFLMSAMFIERGDGKSSSRPSSGHGEEYFHEAHASPVLVDWSANRITRLGTPPTHGREDRLSIGTVEGEDSVTNRTQRLARSQQQRNDTLDGT
uniref:VWFA domain-containing protein n=1 Tax=Ditylenchus dipsaci TaxID=166011 RepID=A0A915CW43_9BILA